MDRGSGSHASHWWRTTSNQATIFSSCSW